MGPRRPFGVGHFYDATCALHAGDTAAAAAEYRRCLDIRKTLATEPNAKMPQAELMLVLARCGEHAEAAKIADSLARRVIAYGTPLITPEQQLTAYQISIASLRCCRAQGPPSSYLVAPDGLRKPQPALRALPRFDSGSKT